MKLQFLQAGEIVSTHGVRGEIKVLPYPLKKTHNFATKKAGNLSYNLFPQNKSLK